MKYFRIKISLKERQQIEQTQLLSRIKKSERTRRETKDNEYLKRDTRLYEAHEARIKKDQK